MNIKNFNSIKSFFFDNVSIKQTIFKNTFWLAASNGISRILTFFLFIYIARILGATEYGKFAFALSFIFLLSVFSDLGLSPIATRELSQGREKERDFPALLSLKILLIVGTLALVLIGSFLVTSDPTIRKIIWILAVYVFIGSFVQIVYAFLEARQKMEHEAWAEMLKAVLFFGFGFFVIFNFPSAENLAYSYLAGILVFLTIFLIFFHSKFYRLRLCWNKATWLKFLKMSWPLALAGFFATIYSQTDSVMMGYFGQITQTGWYNAAYRIIGATLIPVGLISTSIFPILSSSFGESKEKLQKIWNYYVKIMIILAMPLVIGGITLAPKIIDFIYDQSYSPSVLAFQILLFMAVLVFISNPLTNVLVARNQEKKTFFVAMGGMIVNIILNAFLIPKYSLYGAALVTVITYFLMFLLLSYFVLKNLSLSFFNRETSFNITIAGIATLIMFFTITNPFFAKFHVLFLVLVGAAVYFLAMLILRLIIKKYGISF